MGDGSAAALVFGDDRHLFAIDAMTSDGAIDDSRGLARRSIDDA
jgi:hypothetical protein